MEGAAPPPQMHAVSLHVLFFFCDFFSPPDALGVFACVVFFLSFLSSSCVFSS